MCAAQTLDLARRLHADHPQSDLVLPLIENSGVCKRHIVQPIAVTCSLIARTRATQRNMILPGRAVVGEQY